MLASQHSDPVSRPSFMDVVLYANADLRVVHQIAATSLATANHAAIALDGWLVPR
jgi:hypothetical protein